MVSVALLVDNENLQKWQKASVDHLVKNTDAQINTVLINEKGEGGSLVQEFLQGPVSWKAYSGMRRLLWKLDEAPWYRKRVPLSQEWEKEYILPESAEGIGNKIPEKGIDTLQKHDIAVRFGFGILKGEALTAPEHGILSYHHGDIREYRGKPSGFWEILNGEEEVGVTVQKISEELDAGEIAGFNTIKTDDTNSWPKVLDRLFSASEPLLSEAVNTVVDDGEVVNPETLGDLYTTPGLRDTLRYLRIRLTG